MILYENERSGESNSFIIVEGPDLNYAIQHFHGNYELVYVYNGLMSLWVDGEDLVLRENEFLLIFPNQPHSFSTQKNTKSKFVIFSPNYISLFHETFSNKRPRKKTFQLKDDMRDLVIENLDYGSNECTLKGCLYAICGEMLKQTDFYEISSAGNLALTHKLLEYVIGNYQGEITLKDAASKLGYNYQYLSRYIHKCFSVSFSDLINAYRVDRAVYLLKNTDQSITSIAYDCGFKSIRSFNRNFYKMTFKSPSEYRNEKTG